MSGLELFPMGSPDAQALLLTGARVGGVVLIAPMYSSRKLPMMVRALLVIVLAIALLPMVETAPGAEITVGTLLSETLVGFAIGFAAAVFIGAAQLTGELLSVQMGLAGARTVNPVSGGQTSVLSQFVQLFALVMFLVVDGHLLMLRALSASTEALPVGSAVAAAAGFRAMAELGAQLFAVALQFAAPVVAVLLVTNVALGILARTVPQLNVLLVAFPVQIGAGLTALGLALPLIATAFSSWPGHYEGVLDRILSALIVAEGG
ncbi:MAG: flagellar biosynthetic protein FliR [Candidatus Palauibacterales bacterium]|nr:flagellar biosynthetic protein FliR [Candidatus Palauibacterales bacterium]